MPRQVHLFERPSRFVAGTVGQPGDRTFYLQASDDSGRTVSVALEKTQVQVLADRFRARARTATAEEKPEMWKKMAAVWPDYDEYQKKTDREIPVVVLERA